MASGSGETIIVPRNFVLLAELEKAEKGNTDMSVSYGLTEKDDVTLSTWQCTILGQMGSVVDSRIISLIVHCGPQYPVEPPTIQFQSKVNFPFVVSRREPQRRTHPSACTQPERGGDNGLFWD